MNTRPFACLATLIGLSASVSRSDVCGCAIAPRAGESVHIAEESAVIIWNGATRTQHFIRRAAVTVVESVTVAGLDAAALNQWLKNNG